MVDLQNYTDRYPFGTIKTLSRYQERYSTAVVPAAFHLRLIGAYIYL